MRFILIPAILFLGLAAIGLVAERALERQDLICQEGC